MTTDFRALCAELLDWAEVTAAHYIQLPAVMLRARAALADGPAVPQPPADGEVAKLVQLLHHAAEVDDWDGASPEWCQSMLRAAELLQRLSPPQPVPVSERLPRPKDCDAEGRCWWWYPEVPGKTYGYWAHEDDAVPERAFNEQPLHWLPAHALPIPQQQENHQ